MFIKRLCVSSGIALATLLLLWQQAGATILIDDFVTIQNGEVSATVPPNQSTGSSLATVSAIGVERDLFVEKTAGLDGERVRARINPNGLDLLRMTIDEARGRVVVTWDGFDGLAGPNQVNYAGLGSIDFSGETALELLVTFSDIGGPVHITFWDASDLTGNTFAKATLVVPGGVPSNSSVLLSMPLSSFVATGGTLANIFDSVGAIQMVIDATAVAQEGWDARFDYIRTVRIPEAATLGIFGLGLIGLGIAARRRHTA